MVDMLRRTTNLLSEFSIPLIAGVFVAIALANLAPEYYHHAVEWAPLGHVEVLGHELTLHFIVNDLFMVLFFGVAAKEITEACLPGGSLNPLSKALNPLLATAGGVLGPVGVFFLGHLLLGGDATLGDGAWRGWGIPTATDIALAWVVARACFGRGHPAIDFLLLLAIADDAVGLGIIAVFYGDPAHPVEPAQLLWVLAAVGLAFGLRKANVRSWLAYIGFAGPLAWYGLITAHLHPALALVVVVPFIPGPSHDTGLFVAEDEHDQGMGHDHAPLHLFEETVKPVVDLGLFFFAFANAGVPLTGVGAMTMLILASLVVGKTVGITALSLAGARLGLPLPAGMTFQDLLLAGFVAALGLTVALFVSDAAFPPGELQDQAKMGALLSGFVGIAAIGLARALQRRDQPASDEEIDQVAAK